MKINREQFLNTLNAVKAGLSPREFIEQSSCLVFRDGEVMTFNDEVACRMAVDLPITGAVQAANLFSILEKIDDPELMVSESEKGELEFRGKRKAFGVTKDEEIFLPIDKVERPEKWHPLPPEVVEGIALVQHCVSQDESRFLLTCIHLTPEYVEACDNLQLMRCRMNTGLKTSVLVRGSSVSHITSLGVNRVSLTKSWIHFSNAEGLIYSCRRFTEDYPSLDSLFHLKDSHKVAIPKTLADASDRAAVFASDRAGDPVLCVSLSDGRICIKGEGVTGWYREVKKVAYHGPAMQFIIHPDLLKHISSQYDEALIGENKLKIQGGSWEYVTALGRPEDLEEDKEEEPPKRTKRKTEDVAE